MAKTLNNAQPVVTEVGGPDAQGLKYREAETPGVASQLALPPDSPVRKAKGDLGDASRAAPRPLTGRVPFKIKG